MLIDEQKLPFFVAVRMGSFNAVPATNEIVRTRWIGVQDIRGLFRRRVETEFEGFHVVYGVSGQLSAPLRSIAQTPSRVLGASATAVSAKISLL
jgi:hypothetical protein